MKYQNKMIKLISFSLALVMMVNMCAINAFALESEPIIHHDYVGDVFIDDDGNIIETKTSETATEYIVDQYINGELDNTVITDKETWEAVMTTYGDTEEISIYNLHDFAEIIPDNGQIPAPNGSIDWSSSYTISKDFNTDYLYKGQILKAQTLTAAYEPSISTRHNETILNFSKGDKVSLLVSLLLAAFGGAIGIGVAASIGLPVLAGKFTDGFTRPVWQTDLKVSTKVYFDNVYTGLISNTYREVIVSEARDANGVLHTYYADDCYGYDIIMDSSSYAASGCAVAFVDKYITQNNPNLRLPITSLPYYG